MTGRLRGPLHVDPVGLAARPRSDRRIASCGCERYKRVVAALRGPRELRAVSCHSDHRFAGVTFACALLSRRSVVPREASLLRVRETRARWPILGGFRTVPVWRGQRPTLATRRF